MRRVIGMDIHRTFAEVVVREDGRLRPHGRVDMTRSGLEGFARGLTKEDGVVVEATGNATAVVRVLRADSRAKCNGLSEADLDVPAKLLEQGLERGQEAQALP